MKDHPLVRRSLVPILHLFGIVAAHIIQNNVEFSGRINVQQLIHEGDKFFRPMAFFNAGDNVPGVNFQGSIELDSAITLVVMSAPFYLSGAHR